MDSEKQTNQAEWYYTYEIITTPTQPCRNTKPEKKKRKRIIEIKIKKIRLPKTTGQKQKTGYKAYETVLVRSHSLRPYEALKRP